MLSYVFCFEEVALQVGRGTTVLGYTGANANATTPAALAVSLSDLGMAALPPDTHACGAVQTLQL